jgi:redox-sensitive bicupin YhaK (pirin superfamily)
VSDVELLEGRDVVLGGTRGMPVVRTLPNKVRRMVGAWCFVDHYRGADPMRVAPHPHTGLQTVTWLVTGEVRHRDSLANDQLIRPGQLNLMTAGRGIAHAEDSTSTGTLHGVQLWVALPDADRETTPAFAHHGDLPAGSDGPVSVRVLVGAVNGLRSPAYAYTPLVGAEIAFDGPGRTEVALEPDFEHAILGLDGPAVVDGFPLAPGPLLYLGTGRSTLPVTADGPARLLLLGGEPFAEEIVMWWNFIGRRHDDIVAFRDDWAAVAGGTAAGERFGPVAHEAAPLPAPDLPTTTLKPRGRTRSD